MKKHKKKSREKRGEILFGAHSIIEALKANKRKLLALYISDLHPRAYDRIQPHLPSYDFEEYTVKPHILSSLAEGGKHMGVVARFEPFPYYTTIFTPKTHPFIVILDGVQDVHNFGAILRSASCIGVNGIIVNTTHAAPLSGGAHKASAGLAEHIDILQTKATNEAINAVKKAGYHLYLAVVQGGTSITNVSFQSPACLVIGSEENGIQEKLRASGTNVSLPQKNTAISFNAAVAAGIFLFIMNQQLTK